jgi:hypothetical protein
MFEQFLMKFLEENLRERERVELNIFMFRYAERFNNHARSRVLEKKLLDDSKNQYKFFHYKHQTGDPNTNRELL